MSISLDEMTALRLVLNYISIKDLLTAAMNGFSVDANVKSKDNADICFKAVDSFLK